MDVKVIPSLDGIRAIAVLLVVMSHAGLGHLIPGGFGVTTFFFLSGYLITTLLMHEYEKNLTINFKYFFIRRFFRLFPPLLITIIISAVLVNFGVLGGGVSFEGLFFQIFYLANYHSIFNWPGDIPFGTGVFWSLSVEEHFYLIFPFIFYFIFKSHNTKHVVIMLLSICLILLIWRYVLVYYFDVEQNRTYYATDTRIDSILFGCILAIGYNPIFHKNNSKMNVMSYFVLFLSISGILVTFLYRDPLFRETLRYTLQGIFLAPLFYFSIKYHKHLFFRLLNTKAFIKLGQHSYFIYLIHYILINILEEFAFKNNIIALIFFSLLGSLVYAVLLDNIIDVHFRKLRKKYR